MTNCKQLNLPPLDGVDLHKMIHFFKLGNHLFTNRYSEAPHWKSFDLIKDSGYSPMFKHFPIIVRWVEMLQREKFTSKIISNPIDASGAAGPLTGSLRGITNVVVDMKDTRSIKVNTKPINIETSFTGKKEVKDDNYELPKSFFSPMTRNKPRNFMKKWNLNPSELDLEFRYDVKEDRFVFLIIHGGRIKGAIGRALYETKYRWKKYNACDYPFVCGVDNDMGVIVEDCISACRASSVATGVAIMGTSLSEPHKNYIEKNFKSVLICLDPDAKSKSFDIERQLSYNLDKRIVWIKQDLKYYRSDEIKNVLEV